MAPETAQPATSGLKTYSGLPPYISWISTSVPSNTHDSSGHPILGPWPQCWFCPPSSDGILLFNIGPGVYPPGGPPAGLPTPFPSLTIELDGTPEYSSKDNECTTATVTDYWVSCDAAATSCTTTSSNVVSGGGAISTQYTESPSCPADEPLDEGDLGPDSSAVTTTGAGSGPSTATAAPTTPKPSLTPTLTITTKAPTSTQYLPYPTDTNFNAPDAYCYTSSSGNYVEYTLDDGQAVVDSWCERHPVLDPTLVPALVEAHDAGNGVIVYVSARWAPDQSGCKPKQSSNFNDGSGAGYDAFNADHYCTDNDPNLPTSFGGGYVFNSPKSGCIELLHFDSPASTAQVAAALHIVVARISTVVSFNTRVARNITTMTPSGQLGNDPATLTDIGGVWFNSSAVGLG